MRRQIGPIGTAARIAVGAALIVLAVASQEVGLVDVAAALVFLPILAMGSHFVVARLYPRGTSAETAHGTRYTWVVSVAVLTLVVAAATALTFLTAIDGGAIFLFFGASLLVVAARGDAGCEVLAVVNAISGRREATGCVAFSPLDSLEGRLDGRA